MGESKLLRCPFCGENDSISIDKYKSGGELWYFVECQECMANGPVAKTEQDAADAWNRRVENGKD